MMRWLHAVQARARLLFARRATESRMREEFRFHIEMETERLVREADLEPCEARRRALVAFGGVERHKEELRDGRGLGWLSGFSLDLKLGLRMLAKYPGLTIAGVVGMAVAVAICAATFAIISTVVDSELPLPDGRRIVAIQNFDTRKSNKNRRTILHDLTTWRESLKTVEDIGAYRTIARNLITPGGHPEAVYIAEMSASGFRMTRVPPLVGRYFNAADEREGAPPVVVIGYTVWQNRFAGRRDILGQTLQLGDDRYIIIGVMSQGYAFPIDNRIWTPLRLDPSDFERGHAPALEVFGRLAPGATLQDAQTQLSAIGSRLATTYPESHQYIRPWVVPYARSVLDSPQVTGYLQLAPLLVSILLVVIGANVAILVYARTATRMGEITVRNALGASRARVVAQLFAEALVLSLGAATIGIAGAHFALRHIDAFLSGIQSMEIPFWWRFVISPDVILYVAGLTVLAATIIGILPAIQATKRQLHHSLQRMGTGGSGMRLGRTWTVLIVAQVAATVAVLPFGSGRVERFIRLELSDPAFAAREPLMAYLILDQQGLQRQRPVAEGSVASDPFAPGAASADSVEDNRAFAARFAILRAELVRRIEGEPGISDVGFSSDFPGDESHVRMEVDDASRPRADSASADDASVARMPTSSAIGVNRVGLGFFEAFDLPLLAGRRFKAGDFSPTASAVIVNQSLVLKMFGGGNPVGKRVRTVMKSGDVTPESARSETWKEIVGVVPDFPHPVDSSRLEPKMYRPLLPTDVDPVWLAIRTRGDSPTSFTGRLREITVAVSPMLRLGSVATPDELLRRVTWADRLFLLALALLALSALLLSAAGTYALTSLAVTRRRREIGVRLALGGQSRRILANALGRAVGQVAMGIFIGVGVLVIAVWVMHGRMFREREALHVLEVAALMAAVSLIAAIGPARRALRIQPTEALKAE